eukprot:gene1897-1038_t
MLNSNVQSDEAINDLVAGEDKWTPFLTSVSKNLFYSRAFAEYGASGDCDFIGSTLLSLNTVTGTHLELVKDLIHHELHKWKDKPGNIFRANSLASKTIGQYVKQVGREYLKLVLSEPLNELLKEDISFEIDSGKLRDVENAEEICQENQKILKKWTEIFLDRITNEDILKAMPEQVRFIGNYIATVADSLSLNSTVLVGGFIFLRFFNPAIATPEVYNLIEPKIKTKKGQRNLILLTKILQNIANQVTFGQKEQYMGPMNEFVQSKFEIMTNYLDRVKDHIPKEQEDSTINYHNIKPLKEKSLNFDEIDEKIKTRLYSITYDLLPKIVKYIFIYGSQKRYQIQDIFKNVIDLLDVIILIGSPITTNSSSTTINSMNVKPTFQEYFDESLVSIYENLSQFNFKYQPTKSFYKGNPTKSKKECFYLNVSRLNKEMFEKERIGIFLYEFSKQMKDNFNTNISLVLDMTFVGIPLKEREQLLSYLEKEILIYFPQELLRNIQELYIINSISDDVETFITQKICNSIFKNNKNMKIKSLKHWQLLNEYIKFESIVLPKETTMSQPKIYSIQISNSKGKLQDKLLKLTSKSILVIDEKTNYISFEKLFSDIEEISAPPSNLEIHMRLVPEGNKKSNLFFKNENIEDSNEFDVKKFICKSLLERSSILDEIFETVISSKNCKTLQAYEVIKINKTGKKQERLFKLTNDNILNIDGRVIKNEFPYFAIEFIKLDSIKKDTLLIKMLNEETIREIVSSQSNQIIESIKESTQKCKERILNLRENEICELINQSNDNDEHLDQEFGYLTKEDFDALTIEEEEEERNESVIVETIKHDKMIHPINRQLTEKQLLIRKSFYIESVTDMIDGKQFDSDDEFDSEDEVVMEI